eukprot:9294658-Pyramimonas_sp.AAC.1
MGTRLLNTAAIRGTLSLYHVSVSLPLGLHYPPPRPPSFRSLLCFGKEIAAFRGCMCVPHRGDVDVNRGELRARVHNAGHPVLERRSAQRSAVQIATPATRNSRVFGHRGGGSVR